MSIIPKTSQHTRYSQPSTSRALKKLQHVSQILKKKNLHPSSNARKCRLKESERQYSYYYYSPYGREQQSMNTYVVNSWESPNWFQDLAERDEDIDFDTRSRRRNVREIRYRTTDVSQEFINLIIVEEMSNGKCLLLLLVWSGQIGDLARTVSRTCRLIFCADRR
jgi:hypothetical protein